MADTILYSTKEGNDKLKSDAQEAGLKIAFDKTERFFKLVTEGMKPAQAKKAKAAMAAYTTPEAKEAAIADRDKNIAASEQAKANKEVARDAARSRETTTMEKAPSRQNLDFSNALIVYPAPSQKIDYRKDVKASGSVSRYFDAEKVVDGKPVGAGNEHYRLITSVPDKFAQYTGEEARARFQREHLEKGTAPEKNMDTEVARDAAKARAGAAFMVQYKDKGFLLANDSRAPEHAAKQLASMRDATSDQLLAVLRVSRDLVQPLRDKEVQMRADAAHVPVEDFRKRSFAEQREVRDADGNQVQLEGDDRRLHDQLTRGIKALDTELTARGVGQSIDRDRSRSQEQAKDKGEAQQQRQTGAKAPKSAEVAEEDGMLALQRAAARRGQSNGR